ncbi:MAG: hypothetical protein NVS3B25_29680 [Hymenobacter sp.]
MQRPAGAATTGASETSARVREAIGGAPEAMGIRPGRQCVSYVQPNDGLSKVWPLPTYATAAAVRLPGLVDALLSHLALGLLLQLRVEFLH